MNRKAIRYFSFGMMFTIVSIFCYIHFFHTIGIQDTKQILQKNGYRIVKEKEYEDLQQKIASLEEKNKQLVQNLANRNVNQEKPKEEKENVEETVTLVIKKGMTLEEISNLLKQMKIISDKEKFKQYMINEKYDRKIQVGKFILKKDMNYTEIAELITSS